MEDKLKEDLKQAQLAHDSLKVDTLRLLLSEIHNEAIRQGKEVSGEDIISTIRREMKKRKEAAEGFRKGGREDQAKKEESEAAILEGYLPQQLSDEELQKIIEDSITNLEAKNLSDMGKIMAEVMSKVAGQADGGRVASLVKGRLS